MSDETFEFDEPLANCPEGDRKATVLAHKHTLEKETPQRHYLRQQWEVTQAALKVAMDAWRRVWPEMCYDHLEGGQQQHAQQIAANLEKCYDTLNSLGPAIQGPLLHLAQAGYVSYEDVQHAIAAEQASSQGHPSAN